MDFLMDSWTFWMSTKKSTLGKGLKDAHSTTTQPVNLFLWEITFRNTLGRKHIIATNVNIKQHTPAILRCTKEPTLVKNFTDAQYANFPPLDFCSTLISLQYKKSATFQAKILCVFSPVWMREWVFKLILCWMTCHTADNFIWPQHAPACDGEGGNSSQMSSDTHHTIFVLTSLRKH